nr:beta-glucosidase 1-like [Ipomoea batatas]
MLLLYLTEPLSYALEFNLVCREDFADYAEFYLLQNIWRSSEELVFIRSMNPGFVVAALGYDTGFFAPGRCSNCTEPYTVAHNLIQFSAMLQLLKDTILSIRQNRMEVLAFSWILYDWLYMVPWGLYKTVTYVKEQYGNNPRMFLSENGEVKRAVDHGANFFGYFAYHGRHWWTTLNGDWDRYTLRFGIVYIDFNTPKRTRYPKKSNHIGLLVPTYPSSKQVLSFIDMTITKVN